jgi:hypothetical protein
MQQQMQDFELAAQSRLTFLAINFVLDFATAKVLMKLFKKGTISKVHPQGAAFELPDRVEIHDQAGEPL